MTCYLRVHEIVVGVTRPTGRLDWDAAFDGWQHAHTVQDRDQVLSLTGLEPIDLYDLPNADLSRFHGLIVSGRVDQEFLHEERGAIGRFLDDGKVLVFSGEVFRPWLPGVGAYIPGAAEKDVTPDVSIAAHPIFEGLQPEDLGPSFVQGHYPAPADAEVLVSLPGGRAAVYIDRTHTPGTVLVHAGHSLLGYAAATSKVRKVVPQLLEWMASESQ